MATYTSVEFGTMDLATNEVVRSGTASGLNLNTTAAILRFTGLPVNRDTFPTTAVLRIGQVTGIGLGVLAQIEFVINNFQSLPVEATVPNPAWRIADPPYGLILFQSGVRTDVDSFELFGEFFNVAWGMPAPDGSTYGMTLILRGLPGLDTAALITTSAGATLTTVEQSGRTGLAGQRYIDGNRGTGGLVCPKSGRWIARTEAVRDGYTGALVDPRSYDPPEPKPLPSGWRGDQDDYDDL